MWIQFTCIVTPNIPTTFIFQTTASQHKTSWAFDAKLIMKNDTQSDLLWRNREYEQARWDVDKIISSDSHSLVISVSPLTSTPQTVHNWST